MIVIDIGNTNIVFGIYFKKKLKKVIRIKTEKNKIKFKKKFIKFVSDNTKILLKADSRICILSSVVPSINFIIKKYFLENKFKFYILDP